MPTKPPKPVPPHRQEPATPIKSDRRPRPAQPPKFPRAKPPRTVKIKKSPYNRPQPARRPKPKVEVR